MKKQANIHPLAWAAGLCLTLAGVQALAQSAADKPNAAPADTGKTAATEKLQPVVVTGNPLGQPEVARAYQVLDDEALTLRRGATLGDTLDGLAGVGATAFGPNSSRPTLRGLDGDRVRLLNNSGASVDASSLSFDHAVPVDPLVVQRIEVLRGPAALQYGGNAIGGVVNTLDNRIPRLGQPGLSGAAELRLGGAANERGAAVVLDGGGRGFAWHADLSGRRTDDQRAPRFSVTDDEGNTSRGTRVRNSSAEGHSAALGGSLLWGDGHAGLSYDDYRNDYGVTVEPDVRIHMQRQRLTAAGEWRNLAGPLRQLQWQFSRSRYEHQEIEGSGAVGTTFRSTGNQARVEARHAPLGLLDGMVGAQWEDSDFRVEGEEALVPTTRTRSLGLFVIEQMKLGAWTWQGGLRSDSVRLRADESERFGPARDRRFKPGSASLSLAYALSPRWSLQLQGSHSERAPSFYELFADGVHVASGAYERGDATLGLEKARTGELGLVWQDGPGRDASRWSLQLFQTRFSNFIALEATGETALHEHEGEEAHEVPVYQYRGVRARMHGVEIEGQQRLPTLAGWALQAQARLDWVRGSNRSTGEALPRLSPLRVGLGLEGRRGPWLVALDWRGAARQNRVPALDTATPGYGILRLSLARRLDWGSTDALWFLKLDNLGNTLAYNASSIATIRGLAPQAGRSVATGLQLRF